MFFDGVSFLVSRLKFPAPSFIKILLDFVGRVAGILLRDYIYKTKPVLNCYSTMLYKVPSLTIFNISAFSIERHIPSFHKYSPIYRPYSRSWNTSAGSCHLFRKKS